MSISSNLIHQICNFYVCTYTKKKNSNVIPRNKAIRCFRGVLKGWAQCPFRSKISKQFFYFLFFFVSKMKSPVSEKKRIGDRWFGSSLGPLPYKKAGYAPGYFLLFHGKNSVELCNLHEARESAALSQADWELVLVIPVCITATLSHPRDNCRLGRVSPGDRPHGLSPGLTLPRRQLSLGCERVAVISELCILPQAGLFRMGLKFTTRAK